MSLSSCLSSNSDQPLLPLPLSAAVRRLPRPSVITRPSPSAFTLRPLFSLRLLPSASFLPPASPSAFSLRLTLLAVANPSSSAAKPSSSVNRSTAPSFNQHAIKP
ncbi:hypothetical protein RIF29_33958 [Crotalaria pallida]|uniref:Uncharacterized protein n=1 Tax=Crotalaria pallida TaxID=3830 RepID=A0AAN9HR06_CROPI